MINKSMLKKSFTENLFGEALVSKKKFKLPPIFQKRSKSFITELDEIESNSSKRKPVY